MDISHLSLAFFLFHAHRQGWITWTENCSRGSQKNGQNILQNSHNVYTHTIMGHNNYEEIYQCFVLSVLVETSHSMISGFIPHSSSLPFGQIGCNGSTEQTADSI